MESNHNQKVDLVIHEYPKIISFNDGHFITIRQSLEGKMQMIGKIYRDYDPQSKKMTYLAKGSDGAIIFPEAKDLYTLKKLFTEQAKNLAITAHENSKDVKSKEIEDTNREMDLKEIRNQKEGKEQDKEIEH